MAWYIIICKINIIIYIALLRCVGSGRTWQAPVVATRLIKQFSKTTRQFLKAEIMYVTCPMHSCCATIVVSAAISSYEKIPLILSILGAAFVIV